MPKHPVTPAGKKLRELREKAKMTQQQVENEAPLGFGYLQRLERGKINAPKRQTLERILATLNSTYNEQCDILTSFGYFVQPLLPTPNEIERAIQASQAHLQSCLYPAYLLDYSYRLWAWNDHIPALIGQTPNSLKMQRFRGMSVLEIIFDEQYGLAQFAENPDEIFSSVLLTYKATMYPYREQEWSQAMTTKLLTLPLFKKYWDSTRSVQQPMNCPTHPHVLFRINVPGGNCRQFRVLSFPFAQDRRFLIVEYVPV